MGVGVIPGRGNNTCKSKEMKNNVLLMEAGKSSNDADGQATEGSLYFRFLWLVVWRNQWQRPRSFVPLPFPEIGTWFHTFYCLQMARIILIEAASILAGLDIVILPTNKHYCVPLNVVHWLCRD